jgi:hypothetical protein
MPSRQWDFANQKKQQQPINVAERLIFANLWLTVNEGPDLLALSFSKKLKFEG